MIWEPSREFIEQTNVWRFMQRLGFSDREAFWRFSREDPERFRDESMREMGADCFAPYRQVLDASRGPEWAQWFAGVGADVPPARSPGGRRVAEDAER